MMIANLECQASIIGVTQDQGKGERQQPPVDKY